MDKQLIIEAAKTADQCLGYLTHFCVYGSKINISSIKENFPSVWYKFRSWLDDQGVLFDSYDDEFCCQEQTKRLNQLLGSEVSA
jgi:hypothetical protein